MKYNAEILKLIGDFYENHANLDYPAMKKAINKLECMLEYTDVDSTPFHQYFSELYSGRGAIGTIPGADYPAESIIRELFQNAFDSYYSERDIKLAVNFKEDNVISIAYNELSFTLEQLLYFLGVGRNDGDRMREGRFGIGAKSVFMNTDSFNMRSNTFSLYIVNRNGKLEIQSLDLKRPRFKGTEIQITVNEERYKEIFENFKTMSEARGKYMNIVDLCFAFNRKKLLNSYVDRTECKDRTFNIAVTDKGEFVTVYQVMYHKNHTLGIETIRFSHDGSSVVDFICHEYGDIIILVPFAVSGSRRKQVIALLSDRYNFFSTYELTGLLKTQNENFLNKKLSAFFISVPNVYVASSRTGIRHENEGEVLEKVKKGIIDLIKLNKDYFQIAVRENKNEQGHCFLRPESYIFEFVKRFILSSSIGESLHQEFLNSISFNFPDENQLTPCGTLLETAYLHETKGVSKHEHEDGSAYARYIGAELMRCEKALSNLKVKTICVRYTWGSGVEPDGGEEFLYKFYRGEKTFIFSSKLENAASDFNLSNYFMNIAESHMEEIAPDGEFADEIALCDFFKLLDSEYSGGYSVDLTAVSDMEEEMFTAVTASKIFNFSLEKMKIRSLKVAMEVLENHKGSFLSYPAFLRFCDFVMDRFVGESEIAEVLKAMKRQGINLKPKLGKTISFNAYGRWFDETRRLTMSELLFLCDDKKQLFNGGWLVDRNCDITLENLKTSFDPEIIADLLKHSLLNEGEIARRITSVYASDLGLNIIAFLDNAGNIMGFNRLESDIDRKIKASRYIILTTEFNKNEICDIIERIICGQSKGLVGHYFNRVPIVNRILSDQLPPGFKPELTLNENELDELRILVRELKQFKEKPQYKNYFIKDLNYKFYGYGGNCPVCGYESGVLNSFTLCDFSIMCPDQNGKEKSFNFSLLLCANDAVSSESWHIEKLLMGNVDGLEPYQWLSLIKNADEISERLLVASLEYREQIAYGLPGVFLEKTPETILTTPKRSKKINITPLMAAKWIEENS